MSDYEIAGAFGVGMTIFNVCYDIAMNHHNFGGADDMGDGMLRLRVALGEMPIYQHVFGLATVRRERMEPGGIYDLATSQLEAVITLLERFEHEITELKHLYNKHAIIDKKDAKTGESLSLMERTKKKSWAFFSFKEREEVERLEERIEKNLDTIQRWKENFLAMLSSSELEELQASLVEGLGVVHDRLKKDPRPNNMAERIEYIIKHHGYPPPKEVAEDKAKDTWPKRLGRKVAGSIRVKLEGNKLN